MSIDKPVMGEDDADAVKRAALDFMRARSGKGGWGQPEATWATRAPGKAVPAFSNLPQYRQILAHEAAGKLLGIENPFYRPHEGAAGATTVIGERTLLNFASYDYLGLNQNAEVRAAAAEALACYGVSASASRLVAGERPIHGALERSIADLYGVDEAVAMVSGYLTNVTAITCLMGPSDLILHDELIHNSALSGAQFCGATRRSFRHNDLADLDRQLSVLTSRHKRVLVIVEGLYSMDGDLADLPGLIELRARYGFWLMVDEAHALGVLGATGRGSAEHFGCDPRKVDIWMGTLSKTTASCGGYIAGNRELVALLKGYAGGFVYSVGLSPILAAAANAALAVIQREPARVRRLQENGKFFRDTAEEAGLEVGLGAGYSVTPIMVRDSLRAVSLSGKLMEAGVNVLPIMFPAVPEGAARLRFFITSEHTRAQLESAVRLTKEKLDALVSRGVSIGSIDPRAIANLLGPGTDPGGAR